VNAAHEETYGRRRRTACDPKTKAGALEGLVAQLLRTSEIINVPSKTKVAYMTQTRKPQIETPIFNAPFPNLKRTPLLACRDHKSFALLKRQIAAFVRLVARLEHRRGLLKLGGVVQRLLVDKPQVL
jgi:hypothetical protein